LYDQIPEFKRIFKRLLKELELEYQEKNSVQECAHLKVQKNKISECISLFFSRYIEESFFSLFEEKKKALKKLDKLKNKLSLL
jgi:predicted solute-binding protein